MEEKSQNASERTAGGSDEGERQLTDEEEEAAEAEAAEEDALQEFFWLRELNKVMCLVLTGECFYSVFVDIFTFGLQDKGFYRRKHFYDTLDEIVEEAKPFKHDELVMWSIWGEDNPKERILARKVFICELAVKMG